MTIEMTGMNTGPLQTHNTYSVRIDRIYCLNSDQGGLFETGIQFPRASLFLNLFRTSSSNAADPQSLIPWKSKSPFGMTVMNWMLSPSLTRLSIQVSSAFAMPSSNPMLRSTLRSSFIVSLLSDCPCLVPMPLQSRSIMAKST